MNYEARICADMSNAQRNLLKNLHQESAQRKEKEEENLTIQYLFPIQLLRLLVYDYCLIAGFAVVCNSSKFQLYFLLHFIHLKTDFFICIFVLLKSCTVIQILLIEVICIFI